MSKALWTIGYDGRTPDNLIALLREAKIDILVDVRWTPQSRKPGFSKGALWQALLSAGIEYRHLKPLGAPKPLRTDLSQGGDFKVFATGYKKHLKAQGTTMEELAGLTERGRVCVMCLEARPEDCHRSLLAERLGGAYGLAVSHL